MKDTRSISHSKWNCKYHIVWIPKYREKRLFGERRKALGPVPRDLAAHRESEIIEGRLCVDHVHVLIAIPPKYVVARVVGYIKGKSAIRLFLSGFMDCFSRDSLALVRVAEDDLGREHKDFVFIASRTTGTMKTLQPFSSPTWPGRCARSSSSMRPTIRA
jgi:REP element-mobilizing transposase RayT